MVLFHYQTGKSFIFIVDIFTHTSSYTLNEENNSYLSGVDIWSNHIYLNSGKDKPIDYMTESYFGVQKQTTTKSSFTMVKMVGFMNDWHHKSYQRTEKTNLIYVHFNWFYMVADSKNHNIYVFQCIVRDFV